jgi:hypothetical protein
VVGFASTGASCQDECTTEVVPFRLTDGDAQRIETPAGLKCDAGKVAATARGPIITTFCDGAPYAYDDTAGWQQLAGLPPSPITELVGVSGDGSSFFGTTSVASGVQAWRWRSSTERIALHTSPLVLRLDADAVSEDGTVVAGHFYERVTWDGFLWVEGADVTLLPGLGPSSMSAAGDRIVGDYDDYAAPPTDPPVLISRDGTHIPLDAALSAAGAAPGESALANARITRNGELVYGGATLPDGAIRGWLARLPR